MIRPLDEWEEKTKNAAQNLDEFFVGVKSMPSSIELNKSGASDDDFGVLEPLGFFTRITGDLMSATTSFVAKVVTAVTATDACVVAGGNTGGIGGGGGGGDGGNGGSSDMGGGGSGG